MLIRAIGSIKQDGEVMKPGDEKLVQDKQGFELIQTGSAEPANRSSRRVYEAMKKEHDAKQPPAGPDIRDRFVSAPKNRTTPRVRDGRIVDIDTRN